MNRCACHDADTARDVPRVGRLSEGPVATGRAARRAANGAKCRASRAPRRNLHEGRNGRACRASTTCRAECRHPSTRAYPVSTMCPSKHFVQRSDDWVSGSGPRVRQRARSVSGRGAAITHRGALVSVAGGARDQARAHVGECGTFTRRLWASVRCCRRLVGRPFAGLRAYRGWEFVSRDARLRRFVAALPLEAQKAASFGHLPATFSTKLGPGVSRVVYETCELAHETFRRPNTAGPRARSHANGLGGAPAPWRACVRRLTRRGPSSAALGQCPPCLPSRCSGLDRLCVALRCGGRCDRYV